MPVIKFDQAAISFREFGSAHSPLPPVLFDHGMLNNDQLWTAAAKQLAQQGLQ